MKVYITTSDEPIFVNSFLKQVIESLPSEIVGISIVEGPMIRARNQSPIAYWMTLALISNPLQLIKGALITTCFGVLNWLPFTRKHNPLSIRSTATVHGIPVTCTSDPNSPEFTRYLETVKPDILINQADVILKKGILAIPRIGCLNRHGALLPKYRGCLAPFWAYTRMEQEIGVSIHFVEEKLDSGPIVVQKRIKIGRFDTLWTLLRKVFAVAPQAMLEAIDFLRSEDYQDKLTENEDDLASYFSSPKLQDAIHYRKAMVKRMVLGR
jgi:methionyl-tRNA formyltransferase